MSAVPVKSPAPPSATAPADGGQGQGGSSHGKAARVFRWLAGAADWGQYGKHPWWSALLFGPAVAAVLLLAGVTAYRADQPAPSPSVQAPAGNPKYTGAKTAPGGSTARPRVSPSRPAPRLSALPTAARRGTASAAASVTPSRIRSTGPATARTSRPAPSRTRRTPRPAPTRTPRPTPTPSPSPPPPSPSPAPSPATSPPPAT